MQELEREASKCGVQLLRHCTLVVACYVKQRKHDKTNATHSFFHIRLSKISFEISDDEELKRIKRVKKT